MNHRMIEVSTATYAAIWANRQPGEDTEDDILKRLLGAGNEEKADPIDVRPKVQSTGGFYDRRNDVHFPEGFVIYRNYKGNRYEAEARSGQWIRKDTGKPYPTLNQLNQSIAAGQENVWNGNWRYREGGADFSIDHLRP